MTSVEIRQRDFAADMRKVIDEYRTAPSYNVAVVADAIVEQLLNDDRELLYGWLQAHAASTIGSAIRAVDAATRSHARTSARVSVFAEAVAEAERGNSEPLRQGFLQAVYVVNRKNDRKALRSMTAIDVLFVASGYDIRAQGARMEAAFFRALAEKVGQRKVGDVFNNVQLAELRGAITSE